MDDADADGDEAEPDLDCGGIDNQGEYILPGVWILNSIPQSADIPRAANNAGQQPSAPPPPFIHKTVSARGNKVRIVTVLYLL